MGFIKKLVLQGCALLVPTLIVAVPGNLRSIPVVGIGATAPSVVTYPDSLGNIFTVSAITSNLHAHQDLVQATKLSIAVLGFARDYSEEDVDKKSAFIEQELARISLQQAVILFSDIGKKLSMSSPCKKIFDDLAHVLYWNALYRACLRGEAVKSDRSVEVIDASGLNLSRIDFRVLHSIFPTLKKINLSNNQIRHIEDAQLPYIRNLEIDLRGNPLEKVSYGFFNSGCTIEIDENAPVCSYPKFNALYAGARASRFPKSFSQWLLSPLGRRDNRPSLAGSLLSFVVPDFARDYVEQYRHDFVYRSALGSLISRTASVAIPLVRPWFYYPLHDATRFLLAKHNLGTSSVGKILYPLGLTAMCSWLNRYVSRIPGADEISYVWDTAHDFLARNVPFRAQVIGALGLMAVTGVAEYINHKTFSATIKVHRSGR